MTQSSGVDGSASTETGFSLIVNDTMELSPCRFFSSHATEIIFVGWRSRQLLNVSRWSIRFQSVFLAQSRVSIPTGGSDYCEAVANLPSESRGCDSVLHLILVRMFADVGPKIVNLVGCKDTLPGRHGFLSMLNGIDETGLLICPQAA